MTDPHRPDRHQTSAGRRPVRLVACIMYTTFALLVVTIPQSLVNWLADMNGNIVQETLLRGAENLRNVSEHIGIAAPYRLARTMFLAAIGKDAE